MLVAVQFPVVLWLLDVCLLVRKDISQSVDWI